VRLDERHRRGNTAQELRSRCCGSRAHCSVAVPVDGDLGLELAEALHERMAFEQRPWRRLEERPPLVVDGLRRCKVLGEELLNEARVQVVESLFSHQAEDTDAFRLEKRRRDACELRSQE
jgi:hypothetical protein